MEHRIQRVRQRKTQVRATRPHRILYLVPAALEAQYFSMFGLCVSYALPADFNPNDYGFLESVIPANLTRPAVPSCVVVPTGYARYEDGRWPLSGWIGDRVNPARGPDPVEELTVAIPPLTVTVHYGPGPENQAQICTLCTQMQSHLMGLCTPGVSDCGRHVTVPAPHLYRKSRQR